MNNFFPYQKKTIEPIGKQGIKNGAVRNYENL